MTSKRGASPNQRASAGAPSIAGKSMRGASTGLVIPSFPTDLELPSISPTARHLRHQAIARGYHVGFLAGQDSSAGERDAADAPVGAAPAPARRVVSPVEGGAGDAEGRRLGVLKFDHRTHAAVLPAFAARPFGKFAPPEEERRLR